jgi:hypothetical protein
MTLTAPDDPFGRSGTAALECRQTAEAFNRLPRDPVLLPSPAETSAAPVTGGLLGRYRRRHAAVAVAFLAVGDGNCHGHLAR